MSGVRAVRAGGLGTSPTGPTASAMEAVWLARGAHAQRQRLHLYRARKSSRSYLHRVLAGIGWCVRMGQKLVFVAQQPLLLTQSIAFASLQKKFCDVRVGYGKNSKLLGKNQLAHSKTPK